MCALGMGDNLAVKVRCGGWGCYQPLAKSKGADREAGSGGSWRQNPDLRATNPR